MKHSTDVGSRQSVRTAYLFALFAATVMVAGATAPAFAAQDEANRNLDRLGVQDAGVAFFSLKEGLSLPCPYGVIYVKIDTAVGRTLFASLLAAKHAGRTLSRLVYDQGTDGMCYAHLVEVSG